MRSNGKVKAFRAESRSEGEFEKGDESLGAEAEPGDLPMARVKVP